MQDRNRTLGLLLVLAIVIAGVSWLATRGTDAVRTEEPDRVTAESTAGASAPAARVLADPLPPRSARDVEAEPAIESTTAALVTETECLQGTLLFVDGSAPPPCRIRFEPHDTDARASVRRDGIFSVETDASGRFTSDRACSGLYTASLRSFGSNLSWPGVIELPARELRLVFPGYLLRVDVVDAQRRPVPAVSVIAFFDADPTVEHPDPVRIQMDRGTNDAGFNYVHVGSAGEVVLRATLGRLASREETVSLRSTPGLVTHELVMHADPRVAPLRVVVNACQDPNAVVRDHCVVFHDAETGNRELRLCSEDIPLDGIVETLRPGRYRVRPALRYLGEPAYYLKPKATSEVLLDLQEGRLNEVRLCVDVGGRIALLARAADGAQAMREANAEADLLAEDGSVLRRITFRDPDETGVTMSNQVPFGIERVAEEVFVPGEYRLRVVAKGFQSIERTVFVRAGELSQLDVLLPRKE